jgi:hypothetical protein
MRPRGFTCAPLDRTSPVPAWRSPSRIRSCAPRGGWVAESAVSSSTRALDPNPVTVRRRTLGLPRRELDPGVVCAACRCYVRHVYERRRFCEWRISAGPDRTCTEARVEVTGRRTPQCPSQFLGSWASAAVVIEPLA